jgi:hypothetical protein
MSPLPFALLVILAILPIAFSQTFVSTPNQSWQSSPYIQSKLRRKESWHHGSATFYTFGSSGACGFPWSLVAPYNSHGVWTAAAPDPRWSDTMTRSAPPFSGASCGQCYVLKCVNIPLYNQEVFCNPGNPELHVRIADCDTPRPGGWPLNNFDLSQQGFQQIANPNAGMVNVMWKRVKCNTAGARWMLDGDSNGFFHDIVVYDVPGTGTAVSLWVKPAGQGWIKASHAWGSHFYLFGGYPMDGSAKVHVKLGEGYGWRKAQYQPI